MTPEVLFFLGRCRSARLDCGRRLTLLALQFLPCFVSLLLELFLQLALLLFEGLWIGRRAIVGFGEIAQWQRQADRRTLHVDRLHDDVLTLLHLGNHVVGYLVVCHAADRKTDAVRRLCWLSLVNQQASPMGKLHAQRNSDPKNLLAT